MSTRPFAVSPRSPTVHAKADSMDGVPSCIGRSRCGRIVRFTRSPMPTGSGRMASGPIVAVARLPALSAARSTSASLRTATVAMAKGCLSRRSAMVPSLRVMRRVRVARMRTGPTASITSTHQPSCSIGSTAMSLSRTSANTSLTGNSGSTNGEAEVAVKTVAVMHSVTSTRFSLGVMTAAQESRSPATGASDSAGSACACVLRDISRSTSTGTAKCNRADSGCRSICSTIARTTAVSARSPARLA